MIESDARTGELRLHLAMTAIEPHKLFTTFVVSRKFPENLAGDDAGGLSGRPAGPPGAAPGRLR